MKTLRLAIALLATTIAALHGQDGSDAKDQFIKSRKALRSLILSTPENKQSVAKIMRLQNKIKQIEEKNGISELQNRLATLRLDSCRLQQENPEARQALTEIKQISRKIREITKPEREEINRLTSRQSRIDPESDEAKELETKVANIQKQMENKAAEHTRRIRELNKRIYTQLPDQMDAGKRAAADLKNKYLAIKDQVDPLDKQIARQVKAIHRRLRNEQAELKKLRQEIKRARTQISKQDPCFAAKLSAKSSHWIERFA